MSNDQRAANVGDWLISAAGQGSITVPFTGITVGSASDWSVVVHRGQGAATSLITPTITTDADANTVTATVTHAMATTLIGTDANWQGFWYLQSASLGQPLIGSRFVVDRNGTRSGDTTTPTVNVEGSTVTVEMVVASPADLFVLNSLVASGRDGQVLTADSSATSGLRMRYGSAKGPDTIVIGTSIELGSGGDVAYNGVGGSVYLDGYPSNAAYMLHACASSGGRLRMKRNAGVGGDTLGGIGHVLADALAGSMTLDVAVDTGPSTPYAGQTIFFEWAFSRGSLGAGQDACYVSSVETITGGVRLHLLNPTAVDRHEGDEYRHGIIGRFEYDVAFYGADIVVIGGPSNDGNHLTVAQAAAGVQIVVGFVEDMGALPVVSTMLPSSSFPDYIEQGNAALKAQCEDKGTWWFDAWRVVVDPATRGQLTKYSYDTVHLNQEGAMAVAQAFHDQFTDRCEIRLDPRRRGATDGQAINCAPNGTFSSGSTGAGDTFAAAGYSTYTFFGAGFTTGIVPPKLTDTISGNLLSIGSPGTSVGGTWGQKATVPLAAAGTKPAWHVGDRIFLEAFVRLTGFKTDGNCVATICLAVTGTGGSVLVPLFYHWCRDFEGVITNQISTVPSNVGTLTALELQVFMTVQPAWPNGTGLGTLQVGELTLFNLTAGDV